MYLAFHEAKALLQDRRGLRHNAVRQLEQEVEQVLKQKHNKLRQVAQDGGPSKPGRPGGGEQQLALSGTIRLVSIAGPAAGNLDIYKWHKLVSQLR